MRHKLNSTDKRVCIDCGKLGKPRHVLHFLYEFNPIYVCPPCLRRVARRLAELTRIGE